MTGDVLNIWYDKRFNYRINASGQIANRALDGSEQFYLGGMNGVRAYGSSNIGGIVGNNSGRVDQVFNALTNANTISSSGAWGNLAGKNYGGIFNAYNKDTHTENNLHNVGSGYEVVATDYNDTAIWKNYAGQNVEIGGDVQAENLLSVFLTNAQVNLNDEAHKIIYDEKEHHISVKTLTKANGKLSNQSLQIVYNDGTKQTVIGTISVADNKAAHSLQDYLNSLNTGGTPALIEGLSGIKNIGEYHEVLFSHQISSGLLSPNNLGFNFRVVC